MKTSLFCATYILALVATSYARMSRDQLRSSLAKMDPVFAHQRDRPVMVSQNTNIFLPVKQTPPEPAVLDIGQQVASGNMAAGKPGFNNQLLAQVSLRTATPKPLTRKTKSPTTTLKPAPKPTTKSSAPSVQRFNDRFLNEAAKPIPMAETILNGKEGCSFKVPSFLMPDPEPTSAHDAEHRCPSFLIPGPSINPSLVNLLVEHWTGMEATETSVNPVRSQISQIEFEQKCLLPALRAHVTGGEACRSRQLTVYLQWLLHLRQRLFNI
ncbi:hypothetical protein MAR_014614 [Mya arenaria]|uniref:Uncharacterized protein n=1 Tax=Mya arenaria TaxID=6604 RepID=A0ABY7G3A2_MYAAR|nr:uncharacterized protein LOC128218831 [Mya arenaria]XP_052782512.1 uncharacterized protein LOC128218831 [Mya arenaria]XP_052782513.1 uncharacterized protein LOC128218831 [Mya arenaria]XP_052782514.1 uncharacterized protein LOC128218831 [Mya arenaria]WAR28910.1 hypothetical protein MAR_014614 [Mya arenaria]